MMAMSERGEVDEFADALERLLDGEPAEVADERLSSLLEIAHRLWKEAPADEPDPQFVPRLRAELVGESAAQFEPERPSGRKDEPSSIDVVRTSAGVGARLWWRLGAACAALVLFTALAWLGARWPGTGGVNGDLARLPSLLSVAKAYAEQIGEEVGVDMSSEFGDATFRLATALPPAPDRVNVYRQVREPVDEAGARDLAQRLGITTASVVDESDHGVFVVTGDGGRLVVSKSFRGYFAFDTAAMAGSDPLSPPVPRPAVPPPGAVVIPPPDDAEAIRGAGDFLRARQLLDFEHAVDVVNDAPPGATPAYRQVIFTPTAEGRLVRGLGITVTVGPGGGVISAQSALARLVADQAYPIVTPQEAYRQIEEKRPATFQLRVRGEGGSTAAGFTAGLSSVFRSVGTKPPETDVPPYAVGQSVELEGLLSAVVFQARDGQRRYEATLLAGSDDAPTRVQYRLVGTPVEGLAQLDQQHVRVRAQVQALSMQPPGGRLLVESYEKLLPEERLVALLGRLEIEGKGDAAALVLVTDDGQKYLLERPSGARFQPDHRGRRAIVEGRTTERFSKEGYPVLELAGMRSGSDVDGMRDLSGYHLEHPQVVPEREPLLKGEVTVNQVALEYYATAAAVLPPRFASPDLEPFLLVQPVYSVSGTFDQGRGVFEATVPAVRPEYVEGLK